MANESDFVWCDRVTKCGMCLGTIGFAVSRLSSLTCQRLCVVNGSRRNLFREECAVTIHTRQHDVTKSTQAGRLAHGAVEVLQNGTYVGRALNCPEDQRGGSWYQSAYRAAVRTFGAGAYELRPVSDNHSGRPQEAVEEWSWVQ
jgi:hypothetical protein